MLQKLKDLGEAAKNVVIYILTPIAFIVGYIFYLIKKNGELKNEAEADKGKEKLDELQGEQKKVDSDVESAIAEYQRARAEYLQQRAERLRQGNSNSEGSDGDT